MADPSYAFQRFLESLHASRSDRRHADDFQLGALAQLRPIERERAERLLLQRLKDDPSDDRVPGALAIVGSAKAVAPLRAALAGATGRARVRIAAALSALDEDFDATEIYTDALKRGDFVTRGAAAHQLAEGSPELVRQPLLAALEDDHFGVRVAAFEALLKAYDLRSIKQPQRSPLRTVGMRLLSDYASVFTPAANEMGGVIGELDAGKSPDELGLTELPTDAEPDIQRVLDSLFASRSKPSWEQDLDLEAIDHLDAGARRYIECVLLAELHNGDRRIPRALAAMGSDAAVAPLRDASQSLRGSARVQAARALEMLAGDGTGRRALEEMADGERGDEARGALGELDDPGPE